MRRCPTVILGFAILLRFAGFTVSIAAKPSTKMPEPPPALNAGEERLLADLAPLEKIRLSGITIDAPTVRHALEKLLTVVQSAPGGENIRIEWRILDERLADAGPVHYEYPSQKAKAASLSLQSIPASQALVEMLGLFDGTLRGNQDSSWNVAPARLGEQSGLFIAEYKVHPAIFNPVPTHTDPKSENEKDANAQHGLCGPGVTFGHGSFAMYSPASSSLVIKDTIIGQLRWRKTLNEKWPKPVPAKGKKKQKNTTR